MTTNTKTLEAGTLAYDLAQHEPVVIVDPNVGTIEEQDNALEEMIRGSAGNQSCGISGETQCVEVMFCNLDGSNSQRYTFPETRVGVPRMEILDARLSVREFVQYETLKDLMAEAIREGSDSVEELEHLWRDAGLSSDVFEAVEDALDAAADPYA